MDVRKQQKNTLVNNKRYPIHPGVLKAGNILEK